MESKYGESISMEDIDGRKVAARKSRVMASSSRNNNVNDTVDAAHLPTPPLTPQQRQVGLNKSTSFMPQSTAEGVVGDGNQDTVAIGDFTSTTVGGHANQSGRGGSTTATQSQRRKAATDSHNPLFEKSLMEYSPPDFISLQKNELEKSLSNYEAMKTSKIAEREADPVPNKFVYSGQKLQYTELKKGEMRSKLAREKNTHFTYSQTYLGAAVSMVDEERLKQDAAAESKAQWKTQRGFVYPAPRKAAEFIQHPMKPSGSRIDTLKLPWVENELHPQPVSRAAMLKKGQPDFDTIPAQGKELFGGLHVPKYERPYDNNNLGNERRLPRGGMTLNKNNDFYKSVHLSGAGLIAEKQAQMEAEEALWKSKVVVDSLDFKVGGYNIRDKPLQTAKIDDILKGPPLKISLKIVRNAKLPSGKKVPLRPPPISAFSGEAYSDPRDFTADLRPDDFDTFLAKDSTGNPANFMTAIHRECLYPKAQTVRSRRAIPPMTQAEKTGDRWTMS